MTTSTRSKLTSALIHSLVVILIRSCRSLLIMPANFNITYQCKFNFFFRTKADIFLYLKYIHFKNHFQWHVHSLCSQAIPSGKQSSCNFKTSSGTDAWNSGDPFAKNWEPKCSVWLFANGRRRRTNTTLCIELNSNKYYKENFWQFSIFILKTNTYS